MLRAQGNRKRAGITQRRNRGDKELIENQLLGNLIPLFGYSQPPLIGSRHYPVFPKVACHFALFCVKDWTQFGHSPSGYQNFYSKLAQGT